MRRAFAGQYDEIAAWHWWFRARQEILEQVLSSRLSSGAGLNILSLGCGPAPGLEWLRPLAGAGGRVVGLDADPSGALRAERRFYRAEDVAFVLGSLEHPPFAPASFDCVLALDVIEHLHDDAPALRSAASLVRRGGLLMVTVPALPSLWGSQDVVSEHKRRYTTATLLDAFDRAELPAPWTTYFNSLLFPAVAGVRYGRRLLGIERERSDFEDSSPGLTNEMLRWIFAVERHAIGRVRLPIGVSLLALLECV